MYGTNPVGAVDFNNLADQVMARVVQPSARPPEDASAASVPPTANGSPTVTAVTGTHRSETGQAPPPNAGAGRAAASPPAATQQSPPGSLSVQDQAVVSELSRIDQQVRTTASTHATSGAGVAAGAGPSTTVSRGNDAAAYAVTAEIPVALRSNPLNPNMTLQRAQAALQAALPPPLPTATTLALAAQAEQVAAEARADIAKQQLEAAQKSAEAGSEGLQTPDKSANPVVQGRGLNVRV